jgi:hypothetical protein
MLELVQAISFLGSLFALLIGNLSYFFLTRVIKIEHDEFPTQWKEDGSPHGMPFWFPMDEIRMGKIGADPWSKGYRWLFKTPDWVKTHEKAYKMFGYYRSTQYFVFFILFLILVILISFLTLRDF